MKQFQFENLNFRLEHVTIQCHPKRFSGTQLSFSWFICIDLASSSLVFNPFHATGHFLYPLKVLENLWFYNVFRGYKKTSVVWNRLSNQVLIEIAVAVDGVVQGCSVKEVFFKNSQNLQGNTCAEACNFIKKETMAQLFSCEFCEIFENKVFYRTPLLASSVWYVTK